MLKGVKLNDSFVYKIINHYFSNVSEKVKKSPHVLRHTFATIAFQAGVFPKITQEQLGHSDLKTTMKTYTHLNHNAVKTAVNVIGDRLKGYTKNMDK